MNFISQHKTLVIVGAIVLAAIGWYVMSPGSSSPDLVTAEAPGIPANQELVSTLLQLRAVKLDGLIFSDASFMSLKDFSTEIVPEPVGRRNPFAPLGVSGPATASSTHSAQIFTPKTSGH